LKQILTGTQAKNEELLKLEEEIIEKVHSDEYSGDYRERILKSNMSMQSKISAYQRLETMERYEDTDTSEYAKYKNWIDSLLSVPYGKFVSVPSVESDIDSAKDFMKNARQILDKRLSFLEKPKDQIINVLAQMMRNPDTSINAIGLYGAAGIGKTSIVKSVAEALDRPFRTISLGGESDATTLTGHGFTYVGSNPGRIIDILRETRCMNPVVLIDELDKVSETHHGKEIIGTLIHLTDSTTNSKYNFDKYFSGIDFDLSKVLFVFTYNDPSKIDKILADRLFKIKVENYTIKEKNEIAKNHLISSVLASYGFKDSDIIFPDDTIQHIISICSGQDGMREIKRKIEIIVSRINTLLITSNTPDIIKLKYNSLSDHYTNIPVTVNIEHVATLLTDSSAVFEDNFSSPPPGMYI
jgi:ATP-dependent Lon protease